MGAAASPKGDQPAATHTACGAKTRAGAECRNRAGFKTTHVGYGRCYLHLGSTRTGEVVAAREEARHLAAARKIHPHDALIEAVEIAAGEVHYATLCINSLLDDDLVETHQTEVSWDSTGDRGTGSERKTTNDAAMNVWVRFRHEALDRMVRYSKVALDAGIAEREVRLAESAGRQLSALIDQVLTGHGITPADRKPEVVRAALYAIEGGKAQAA